eukprot:TRINITY_DN2560_c0_g2_i13.p4 TRINITY_DN2560_c0_g2~~TRINITY_DN2560_c0_g2_i13.p4  ORF type:complete len:224 (+),score=33.72 TRINITY_DN2560_c0_g2_i13:2092-2763(+)
MSKKGKAYVTTECITRLQKEYKLLKKEPVSCLKTHPNPSNICEWYYAIEGAEDSPFEGGVYFGKITFPPDYPYKPPSIIMTTPNGRFQTGANICMSMTDFHPETWNPFWNVGTILTGLMSYMYESSGGLGTVETTPIQKRKFAVQSWEFNSKQVQFKKLFPEYVEGWQEKAEQVAEKNGEKNNGVKSNDSQEGGSRKGQVWGDTVWVFVALIGIGIAYFYFYR